MKEYIWNRSPIFLDSITNPQKFIDSNGNHPKIMDTIDGIKIVLSKEELVPGKWLFITDNEQEKEKAQKQIKTMVFNNDWTLML